MITLAIVPLPLFCGIEIQVIVPYAHSQNGKAEWYIHTLEDSAQMLLADASLPPEFLSDAVLTVQYLHNHSPTSTLPAPLTLYEVLKKKKPDLSHFRVWGCQCFSLIPPECWIKGGLQQYEGIFVGYEKGCIGWHVRSTSDEYYFSRDVIFNENAHGSLRHSPHLLLSPPPPDAPPSSHPICPHLLTEQGQAYLDTVCQRDERLAHHKHSSHGGVPPALHPQQSLVAIDGFLALVMASSLPDPPLNFFSIELDILLEQKSLMAWPDPLHLPHVFNLSKPPDNFCEAMAHPDADVWCSAMGCEHSSLMEHGVFKPAKLPTGRKAIGVCWVYAYKYHPDGSIIKGKEEARLIAQGFSQQPKDYGTTYAPVTKLTSICIVLVLATKNDYEILIYDVKTAFLHALLDRIIFCKHIPGFPIPSTDDSSPADVLQIICAVYGLQQSSHEFYVLLHGILESIGLIRCEVDHAVFYSHFSQPPHPSILMPSNSEDLVIFMLVHVDDGLVATNSLPLYHWILAEMNKCIEVVDQGAVSLYLGIWITHDCELIFEASAEGAPGCQCISRALLYHLELSVCPHACSLPFDQCC